MKILLFAPHAAVWVHAFPEALVAEALEKEESHEIIYITCGGQFKKFCVAMSAHGLNERASRDEKERICRKCQSNKELIKKSFNFTGYDLEEKLSANDYQEIKKHLDSVTKENFLDYSIHGIKVGRVALYQFLLMNKKQNLIFSEEEWSRYLIEMENALFALYAIRKILDTEKPERVITYNSLYSVNNICFQLAEQKNIPGYFLHAGCNISNRLETLYIGKSYPTVFTRWIVEEWNRFKNIPCTQDSLSKITDHFLELFKGRNVFAYSSPKSKNGKNVRDLFGAGNHQKFLVAALSSYDEIFAAEIMDADSVKGNSVFSTQMEWIKELIQFVKWNPDLFLVIRVHPREFPNKRESVKSEHAVRIEKELIDLPENVKVNWPTDELSIYDLAEEADLFLNAWSSVGKEMTLLGIPVLLTWPNLAYYPSDLNFVAGNKEEYFLIIREALKKGWSFENVRKAYRWYVLEYERTIFDISDSFKINENSQRSFLKRVFKVLKRLTLGISEEENACKKRASRLSSGAEINQLIEENRRINLDMAGQESRLFSTLDQETEFLKQEMARLIQKFYPGKSVCGTSPLKEKMLQTVRSGL